MKKQARPGPIWDRGLDILRTVRDATTNTIRAFLGDAVFTDKDSGETDWAFPVGIVARPHPAKQGKPNVAVQAYVLRGQRDVVFGVHDPVGQKLASELAEGETCIYAVGADPEAPAQGRVFFKKTGAVVAYTRVGNTADGAGMTMMLDPATNQAMLLNGSGFGLIADPDGVTITAGAAAGIRIGKDGTIKSIATGQNQIDGASVLIGAAAAPLVNGVLVGPTGIAGTPSAKVLVQIA